MLTVLMATHNGAQTLPIVLGAYCDLQPPSGGWKLVIVDNASTDSTREVIHSFQNKLPMEYLLEPRIGKSYALNTGIEHVAGDLAVLTDDDAVPEPDWLRQIRLAAENRPEFSIFGGAIIPRWEVPPEPWIHNYLNGGYAITNPAWEEGPIVPERIFGPNMTIRASLLERGHRFNVSLGPFGSNYQRGEDTDFLVRIVRGGSKAWHCKSAVVAHIIRKHQMTKKWLLQRAMATGKGEYQREFRGENPPPALLWGVPRYMVREILLQALRVGRVAISGNRDRILRERWRLNFLTGRALGGRDLYHLAGKTVAQG